jgi:hypothetical protein
MSTDRHVFLCVQIGNNKLRLSQINIAVDPTDDLFFKNLKSEYQRLRGRLRRWFSVWIYDHCEFIKVRSQHSPDSLLSHRSIVRSLPMTSVLT